MAMPKKHKKTTRLVTRFEPGRVIFMVVIVSVLTLVFVGILTTL